MNALPLLRPRDTWDWLTLGDLERAVFCSFLDACRMQTPPQGERFLETCPDTGRVSAWAGREDFRDALIGLFTQRVNVLALGRGVTRSSGCVYNPLPRGYQWPEAEAMAQGCAAVAVGAGAPLETVPNREHNLSDNPLFACPSGQDLPCSEYPVDTQNPHGVNHES
jgi:hypothetical protein